MAKEKKQTKSVKGIRHNIKNMMLELDNIIGGKKHDKRKKNS